MVQSYLGEDSRFITKGIENQPEEGPRFIMKVENQPEADSRFILQVDVIYEKVRG